eukprot:Lankesteria_metandrocarpae@DN11237_c0_g1_i1.p1
MKNKKLNFDYTIGTGGISTRVVYTKIMQALPVKRLRWFIGISILVVLIANPAVISVEAAAPVLHILPANDQECDKTVSVQDGTTNEDCRDVCKAAFLAGTTLDASNFKDCTTVRYTDNGTVLLEVNSPCFDSWVYGNFAEVHRGNWTPTSTSDAYECNITCQNPSLMCSSWAFEIETKTCYVSPFHFVRNFFKGSHYCTPEIAEDICAVYELGCTDCPQAKGCVRYDPRFIAGRRECTHDVCFVPYTTVTTPKPTPPPVTSSYTSRTVASTT